MKRLSTLLGRVLLVELALLGMCGFTTLFGISKAMAFTPQAASPSFVRIIHASPFVGTADVFVDGSKLLSSFPFGQVTGYATIPPGPHKVQIALLGEGIGASALTETLAVSPGAAYTVAAIGTQASNLSLQVFVDNNTLSPGTAKFRTYELSPDAGSVSVASGGQMLVSGISYQNASNYLVIPAGAYTFDVSSSATNATLSASATLGANMVASLFVVGLFNGTPKSELVSAQTAGLPGVPNTGSDPNAVSQVDAAHGPSPASSMPWLWPLGIAALLFVGSGFFFRRATTKRGSGSGSEGREAMRPVRPLAHLVVLTLILLLDACSSSAAARTAVKLKQASQETTPTPALSARRAGNDVLHPMPPLTPLHLTIATVGIDARIEPVGVQTDGELATPPRDPWDDVGWDNLGPLPGKPGSAVIDGHLDRPGGYPAVFWRLREVQIGDAVQVTNAAGQTLRFRVTGLAYYPPDQAPIQDIFGNLSGTYLNLITCAGDWIPSQHQTTLRLVVYTTLI